MHDLKGKISGWKAVADLGSNAFQFLIARFEKGNLITGYREKKWVQIGKGGIGKEELLPLAVARAKDALNEFGSMLKKFGLEPSECTTIATSAFRNSFNGVETAKTLSVQTGFSIQIISGDEEAKLIYKGVKASQVLDGSTPNLIVDIGGGSVEFIIALDGDEKWRKSFEIGGLRLLEKFKTHDPLSVRDIEKFQNYYETELEDLWKALNKWPATILVGSSGAFETLIEMIYADKGKYLEDVSAFPHYKLEFPDYEMLKQKLLTSSLSQRLNMSNSVPARAETIVLAVILTDYLLKKMENPQIRISTFSLKEGCLFDNYENQI